MVSFVTVHITDCRTNVNLGGALVSDGYNSAYTNSYGEVLIYFDDPIGYGLNVSKPGYVARGIAVYAKQSGSRQTFCLDPQSGGGGGGGGGGGSGGTSCFIASAAIGSAEAEDIVVLRALRDEAAARSSIAASLIDAVYAQYWQFSPAVAEKLKGDGLARQGVLMAVVRPLVAWYRLAAQLAFEPGDRTGAEAAAGTLRKACPAWMSPASVAELVATMRRGEPVPARAPQMLHELAPQLGRTASLPLVDWAILRPLQTCWEVAARKLDPAAEIGAWLGDAPVERIPALPGGDHKAHLAAVSALLAFDPPAQARLIGRLGKLAASDGGCRTCG